LLRCDAGAPVNAGVPASRTRNVAVPLPAAAWLFGSALFALGALKSRTG